jgi:hypothetical protein
MQWLSPREYARVQQCVNTYFLTLGARTSPSAMSATREMDLVLREDFAPVGALRTGRPRFQLITRRYFNQPMQWIEA